MEKNVETRRVSITILEKDYKQIHRLVAQNKYLSFSEFIRESIRIQLNENIKNEEFKKISASLHNIDVALQ